MVELFLLFHLMLPFQVLLYLATRRDRERLDRYLRESINSIPTNRQGPPKW